MAKLPQKAEVDDDLADTFDRLVKEKGYVNRSEAFRDLVRGALKDASIPRAKQESAAIA